MGNIKFKKETHHGIHKGPKKQLKKKKIKSDQNCDCKMDRSLTILAILTHLKTKKKAKKMDNTDFQKGDPTRPPQGFQKIVKDDKSQIRPKL